ncbi:hypothetical protein K439DRAFT_561162 [Ramaria rubella]|nr:hypothetical protein K439DRAFT_561162 [Ramaria rubella]
MAVDHHQLAVTGSVPIASEYSNIKIDTEGQRRELTPLDEETTPLENQLSHLQSYGIESWRSGNPSTDFMAPIHKVPPKILGEIFVMSLPSISWQEVENENHWFFRDDPYKTHCIIKSTCRHWSAVFAETPRMWSTIMIRNPPLKIDQIEKIFQRSKSCLLDVYLGAIEDQNSQQIKSIIDRHAARLRLLCIASENWMFGDHSTVELPNLQVFSTVFFTDLVQTQHLPKLSALRFRRDAINPFMDSLSTLRCLVCCAWAFTGPVPTAFDILERCPNLQYLDWQDYREFDEIIHDSHMEKLHLPFLEVFKIIHTSTSALHLLLGMKVSQLCRLSFHLVSFTDDYEFGSLLNHFPSLTSLCLNRCALGPIFFPSSTQDLILHKPPD